VCGRQAARTHAKFIFYFLFEVLIFDSKYISARSQLRLKVCNFLLKIFVEFHNFLNKKKTKIRKKNARVTHKDEVFLKKNPLAVFEPRTSWLEGRRTNHSKIISSNLEPYLATGVPSWKFLILEKNPRKR
jgi:hypothetical protein